MDVSDLKGLILCGGHGLRMRPFSLGEPKQLLPVANRPVLAHAVAEMQAAGVTELVLVTGAHTGPAIRRALEAACPDGPRTTYVVQEAPRGLAHAVATAAAALGGSPFLLQLGDNLVPGGAARLAAVMRQAAAPAAAVLVAPVSDPSRYGIAVPGPDGCIQRLVEKPPEPPGNLALVGVYAFSPEIHAAIAGIRPSPRGELEITDALQRLVELGRPVLAIEHRGWWFDVGTPPDLLAANRRMLEGRPVSVGAGTRISACTLRGPVLIGDGCELEEATLGPFVCVGDGARLRRCRIEESVILPGARIDAPGKPLRESILGRAVTVRGGASLRLLLGDHASLEGV